MKVKIFSPVPGVTWEMGEAMPNDWHVLLGPCPACGNATFDYGGGWRCLSYKCDKNASNPAPNVGPRPSWWYEDINVFKDGNAWCATYDDFVNPQESAAGFGETPDEAVKDLKSSILKI